MTVTRKGQGKFLLESDKNLDSLSLGYSRGSHDAGRQWMRTAYICYPNVYYRTLSKLKPPGKQLVPIHEVDHDIK